MKIIEGDIFDVTDGIIMHQVNCRKTMGSGVAKSFRNLYPEIYTSYINFSNQYTPEERLGKFQQVQLTDTLIGVNSYSQLDYGTYKKQTDENLLIENIYKLDKLAKSLNKKAYVPYLIGCALGGGDWQTVEAALIKTDITVVKYKK